MTREELSSVLRKEPFEPFRLRMADGYVYEVNHPELVWIHPLDPSHRIAHVGLEGGGAHRIDLDLVAAIEHDPGPGPGTNNTASGAPNGTH